MKPNPPPGKADIANATRHWISLHQFFHAFTASSTVLGRMYRAEARRDSPRKSILERLLAQYKVACGKELKGSIE